MKSIFKSFVPGLFMILLVSPFALRAQTLKEFFNSSEVPLVYLGIDFTHAKVLNDITANAMDIRDRQYAAINQVVVNEPKKYDFQKAFSKTNVTNDINLTAEKNSKIDAGKIVESSSNEVHLMPSDVDAIVKSYNFSGKKGVGVMFIMETMNKTSAQATLYVALIDLPSGKVLLTERFTEKAAGFGFRNYWAKTIWGALEDIRKEKYKEWKSANG